MKEQDVYNQLSQWLKLQHPNLIWRWDYAAGQKMSVGMAMRMKKMQCDISYPDLFIAKPVGEYAGLFIEVKLPSVDLYQKRDTSKFATPHLEKQNECLDRLQEQGYKACFGFGFEQCKQIIELYLKNIL